MQWQHGTGLFYVSPCGCAAHRLHWLWLSPQQSAGEIGRVAHSRTACWCLSVIAAMSRSRTTAPTADSFDAFLSPSDVEQVYIVLSLARQSHGNDMARGVQTMLEQPATFARTAMAHQDAIARRHYGIASLFGVIVLAMGYVLYQAMTTPDVGLLGMLLPAAMAMFALWRMERAVDRGRQGNLLLLRLLDALDGQPYSYDAAKFEEFIATHAELASACSHFPPASHMALQHLAALKLAQLQAHPAAPAA